MKQRERERRLRDLILYLSRLSEGDHAFGRTKLSFLLYFCDFTAYHRFGEAITQMEYVRRSNSPEPKFLEKAYEALKGAIVFQEREAFGHTQYRPIAIDQPDLSALTGQQIDLVNELVRRFWGLDASEIAASVSDFNAWRHAGEGETIPYSIVLVGSRRLTPTEIEQGRSLTEQARDIHRRNVTA